MQKIWRQTKNLWHALIRKCWIMRRVMTNLHILVSCYWFFTATTSLSATRDHYLCFQFDPLILNAITLCYNCDLVENGCDVTVVPLLPFQVSTAGKCLSNLKKEDLHCTIVLNSISFWASVWICQSEPWCTFIMRIRSKLGQSTTCLGFVFIFHNSGGNSDLVWTSQLTLC